MKFSFPHRGRIMVVFLGLLALILGWMISHYQWGGPLAIAVAVALPIIFLIHRRMEVGILLLFSTVCARFALEPYLPVMARYLLVEGILLLILFTYAFQQILTRNRQQRGHNPLTLPLACFLVSAIISAAITLTPPVTVVAEFRALLLFVPLYYVILYTPWQRDQLRISLAIMLVMGLLVGAFGLTQIHSDLGFWGGERLAYTTAGIARIYGVMMNPNALGVFLLTFLLLGFAWYPAAGRWRSGLLLLLILGTLALICTFSRSSYLGFIVGGAAMCLVLRWYRPLAVAGMIAVLLLVTVPVIQGRITYGLSQRYIDSSYRISHSKIAFSLLKDHLFFGVGPGQFGGSVSVLTKAPVFMRLGAWGQIDSFLVAQLCQFGVIGTLMYLAMAGALILHCFRAARRLVDPRWRMLAAAVGGGMIGTLICSASGPILELQSATFLFWILPAFVIQQEWSEARKQPASIAPIYSKGVASVQ